MNKNTKKNKTAKRLEASFIFLVILLLYAVQASSIKFSEDSISEVVKLGDYKEAVIKIENGEQAQKKLTFMLKEQFSEIVKIDRDELSIPASSEGNITVTLLGRESGSYNNTLIIGGDITYEIPISFVVSSLEKIPVEALLLEI